MEWYVRRMFECGRLIKNQHLIEARVVRGSISIEEVHDDVRKRHVRVARLVERQLGSKGIPALFDVQLTGAGGARWALSGHERVMDASSGVDEWTYGQAWILDPAPNDDLMVLQEEVTRLCRLLAANGIVDKMEAWRQHRLAEAERSARNACTPPQRGGT